MGCIYSNVDGECQMHDEGIENPGCEGGFCICEEDPDPSYLCEMYESDGND
jgi:hypothetical protein